jgi:hypothetical protein
MNFKEYITENDNYVFHGQNYEYDSPKLYLYTNGYHGDIAWAKDVSEFRKVIKKDSKIAYRVVNKEQKVPNGYEHTGIGLAHEPVIKIKKKTPFNKIKFN